MPIRALLILAFLCFTACPARADDVADDVASKTADRVEELASKTTFFETHIRPLLIDRCFECHNEDVQESDLRLDSLQAMIDGGQRGPTIIVGDAKNSLLIHAVSHSEADLQMPEGDKLTAVEIRNLIQWIDDGAIWPGQQAVASKGTADEGPLFSDEEKSFWAFVPPAMPTLPAVQDTSWVQADLDRFILARLESSGLRPAPPASKRSLIRRAYFDLIGLPPTPQQVDDFLADDSPQAFERVIDRLLAMPQYGERWGRHWLDVARYADSNGLDENWAFEFIYHYRDWVIDAFNDDMPYPQFVAEQLAGDLIEQQPDESLEVYMRRVSAVGFLSVGPKMIADDDPVKKKMDIIDEQLNTVSQTFMGLTVGCARCHDHKFDPIPTWDYYAMASIFKSTKTMEHLRVVAPVSLHEFKPPSYKAAMADYDAGLQPLVAARDAFWLKHGQANWAAQNQDAAKKAEQRAQDGKAFALPTNAEEWIPAAEKDEFERLAKLVRDHEATKPQTIKIMAPSDGEIEDLQVSLRGNYLTKGAQTRRQFLRIIDGEEPKPIQTTQSGRLELARWMTKDDHPLTARVLVNRVWRWRFGQGIVATPDNFGRLGARPTHPDLLDWLALTFVRDGWSLKQLHKRIMLSSTYQMSTRYSEPANEIDPENQLLWRFPRLRLEAEVIRDSILAISDNLDSTMYGSMMPLKDRSYVTGTASKQQRYDNPRRSVYQPVYRSAVYDVLTAFDFPDPATPTGDRKNSVVAPQALLMMNSPLVADHSRQLAIQLLEKFDSDDERLAALFEKAVSRPPTDRERAAILFHLDETEALLADSGEETNPHLTVWQGICRAVISSNEFLYLD